MHRSRIIIIGLILFLRPIRDYSMPFDGDTTKSACLQKAAKVLDEAIGIMQKSYYKKDAVNWDSLSQAAKQRLSEAESCDDIYGIIDWCFKQFNEPHSFIMPPSKAAAYCYDTTRLKVRPVMRQMVGQMNAEAINGGIGYITVPWVGTTDPSICSIIADSLQHEIAMLDKQGVSKWIIDLRANSGGNCWPMLAGLGPLLGDGICGYFVSESDKVAFSYQGGAAFHGPYVRCQVQHPYELKNSYKQIIVLTSGKTCSSGEIIALAFKGKERVSFYGEPTAGFTTANTTYNLSDNSMLVLTICKEADCKGKVCEGKIIPNELFILDPQDKGNDLVKTSAIMWLQSL